MLVIRHLRAEEGVERQDLRHFVPTEFVQCRLEVIQDDGVREALENEVKLPERIDHAERYDWCDGEDIDDDEDQAESHGEEQNGEPGGRADDVKQAKLIAVADVIQQIRNCKDPPRVTRRGTGEG